MCVCVCFIYMYIYIYIYTCMHTYVDVTTESRTACLDPRHPSLSDNLDVYD